MNGHSDVIMGAAMTNDDDVHTRLRFLQNGKFGDYSFYLKKKKRF
jgi:cystathionine beta-lyase/cystathionine gamma-synthase